MPNRSVEQSFEEPYIVFQCDCGWRGYDRDIVDWDVQTEYDRIVRKCPSCQGTIPEWGALAPIDGVARIARDPLQIAIEKQTKTV